MTACWKKIAAILIAGGALAAGAGWMCYQCRHSLWPAAQSTAQGLAGDAVGKAGELARQVVRTSSSRYPEKGSSGRRAKPADLFADLLDLGIHIGHDASRVGNDVLDELAGLTDEEERETGKQVHNMIAARHRLSTRAGDLDRLHKLAAPLLAKRQRKGIHYRFFVIDDPAINAFAHLGGYVYVNSGLLALAKREEELSFVLGHEIAHCDQRHCVSNMTVAVRAGQIGGSVAASLASLAYQTIALGYSENNEFAADAWSYDQLRAGGYSKGQALAGLYMLRHLAPHRQHRTEGQHRPTLIDRLNEHFRSHPEIEERIARLEAR